MKMLSEKKNWSFDDLSWGTVRAATQSGEPITYTRQHKRATTTSATRT